MAKYLVKEDTFVNNNMYRAGDVIDYTPPTVDARGKKLDTPTTVSANLELVKGSDVDPTS